MQQWYTFGHLSLIQRLTLDIPSRVATVRDGIPKKKKKKKRFGYLLGHLSFWVVWSRHLFFLYQKIRKTKYIIELLSSLIQ